MMYNARLINSCYCKFYDKTPNEKSLMTLEKQLYSLTDSITVKDQMLEAFNLHFNYSITELDETIANAILRLVNNHDHNFNLTMAHFLAVDTESVISRSTKDGLHTFSDGSALFVVSHPKRLFLGKNKIEEV